MRKPSSVKERYADRKSEWGSSLRRTFGKSDNETVAAPSAVCQAEPSSEALAAAEAKLSCASAEFKSASEEFSKVCSYFNCELVKASARRLLAASDEFNAFKLQYKTLCEFISTVEAADIANDDVFKSIVCIAMTQLELTDLEMATEFSTSLSTISRWQSGLNAPLVGMRNCVIKFFVESAHKKMQ